MRFIPAFSDAHRQKTRQFPSHQSANRRLRHFAEAYRAGRLTPDDIPMYEREDVMVYLLEHPKAERKLA